MPKITMQCIITYTCFRVRPTTRILCACKHSEFKRVVHILPLFLLSTFPLLSKLQVKVKPNSVETENNRSFFLKRGDSLSLCIAHLLSPHFVLSSSFCPAAHTLSASVCTCISIPTCLHSFATITNMI